MTGDRLDDPTLGEAILTGDRIGDRVIVDRFMLDEDRVLTGDSGDALFSCVAFSFPCLFDDVDDDMFGGGNNKVATGSFLVDLVTELSNG